MFATAFFVLCLGPFVGSFIGVLIDRMPRGEDVIVRPSRCLACDVRLRWRDLIPIFSFATCRGQCRTCSASIPARLLYLELIALGLGLLAVGAGGTGPHMLLTAVFLWLLLALAACDLVMFRLPDPLTAILFVIALLRVSDIRVALLGGAIAVAVFAGLRWGYARWRGREGLGMGDVKLMAGLGAASGPFVLPELVLIAACLALVGAVVASRYTGRLGASTPLPFGAALCASAAILWCLGRV